MNKDNFDGCQDDTRVDVLKLRCYSLAYVLRFLDIAWVIIC